MRQFYGRLEICVLFAGKTHVHKIPPFGGGGILNFWGGRGGVPILFLWARGFFSATKVATNPSPKKARRRMKFINGRYPEVSIA